jgi:hypothetical protein
MSDEYGFQIDVPVRTEWQNVTLLVTSVQNCFHAMFADLEGSHMVAMVAGELLENAIKYGTWKQQGDRHLRLRVSGRKGKARVTVENPARPEAVAEVARTLDWMKEHASADAAYRARLMAIAETADPDVSKLGLIRIAYEGRGHISCEYEDGVLRVIADLAL